MACRIYPYRILELCLFGKPVLFGFTEIQLSESRRSREDSNIIYGVDDMSLRNCRGLNYCNVHCKKCYNSLVPLQCSYEVRVPPSPFIPANILRIHLSEIRFEKSPSKVSVFQEASLPKFVRILQIYCIL